MPRISQAEYKQQIDRDFPDGFLASFDRGDRERRMTLHVIELAEGGDMLHLVTSEDLSGKTYDFTVQDYEIIQESPKLARILTIEYDSPFLFSDNMGDELRIQMRNARANGEDFPADVDPPLRPGTNQQPSERSAEEILDELIRQDLKDDEDSE